MIRYYFFIITALYGIAYAMDPEIVSKIAALEANKRSAYSRMSFSVGAFTGACLNLVTGGPWVQNNLALNVIVPDMIFLGRARQSFDEGLSLSSDISTLYHTHGIPRPVEDSRIHTMHWLGYARWFLAGVTTGATIPSASKMYLEPEELKQEILYGPAAVASLSLVAAAIVTKKIHGLSSKTDRIHNR